MGPMRSIEEVIRNKFNVAASPALHDRVLARVRQAKGQFETTPALREPTLRRMIMRSPMTKLAVAAAIVVAGMAGMYALTGSVGVASITMAQVRQAMENVNWMQVTNKAGKDTTWYSFAAKVQIAVDGQGRIVYCDFNGGKKLIWSPGSPDIYESRISPASQAAGSLGGPFEVVTKMFDSLEASQDWKVTKGPGTYQSRKVEVWTARRAKGESGLTSTWTMYIDVERKLPVAFTDGSKAEIGFQYPETGPADIYAAGAPKSAQIKPAPEGQTAGEQVSPK